MIFELPWLYDTDGETGSTPRCITVELLVSYPFDIALSKQADLAVELSSPDGFGIALEADEGLECEIGVSTPYEIEIGGLCNNQ
jgi:hypothetical protein